MTTERTTSPEHAAAWIRRGEVVAFPTETVYGLGADAFQPDAVQKIFEAKGRPSDNPLIVHVADRAQVADVAASVPEPARRLMQAFFPGPLTLILPKHPRVPDVVTAGLDTVGVRMPRHPIAQAFLTACSTPVAAPSANRSGRPSPTTWEAVGADLDGRIPCILQGGRTPTGLESTVVDVTQTPPVVLRPGSVPLEALREIVPDGRMADTAEDQTARSPGTQHRHYAPTARVRCVRRAAEAVPDASAAYIGTESPPDPSGFGLVHVAPSVEAYAREVFHFFRTADDRDCRTIYAQVVGEEGLGRALNDRLRRAEAR
jgi:L-threonylcarbamoyladenylate synthase